MVSAIPAEVRIETFVRAATAAALSDANRKVDRALRAGALALGAQLELTTVAGYLPMRQSPELVGADGLGRVGHRGGGTDMGDLGHIMPVLHPFAGGASGSTHGADFRIDDYDAAAVTPAKAMAMTVVDLLADNAAGARRVLDAFHPHFDKDQYLEFVRSLSTTHVYDSPE